MSPTHKKTKGPEAVQVPFVFLCPGEDLKLTVSVQVVDI